MRAEGNSRGTMLKGSSKGKGALNLRGHNKRFRIARAIGRRRQRRRNLGETFKFLEGGIQHDKKKADAEGGKNKGEKGPVDEHSHH